MFPAVYLQLVQKPTYLKFYVLNFLRSQVKHLLQLSLKLCLMLSVTHVLAHQGLKFCHSTLSVAHVLGHRLSLLWFQSLGHPRIELEWSPLPFTFSQSPLLPAQCLSSLRLALTLLLILRPRSIRQNPRRHLHFLLSLSPIILIDGVTLRLGPLTTIIQPPRARSEACTPLTTMNHQQSQVFSWALVARLQERWPPPSFPLAIWFWSTHHHYKSIIFLLNLIHSPSAAA